MVFKMSRELIPQVKKNKLPYLLILPTVACLSTLLLYPLISGIRLSFYDKFMPRPEAPFIGLENYRAILLNPIFGRVIVNTFVFTVTTVIFQLLLGMWTAILVNQKFRGRSVIRGILILPWAIPPVAAIFTWRWMYSDTYGIINALLKNSGLVRTSLCFLGDASLAMPSVVIYAVWKGFPVAMVILLAGLQAVPIEQYEAAEVDGASVWQKFRYITIPHIEPMIMLVILLATISTFSDFSTIFLFTRGGPSYATQVLATEIYETTFSEMRMGRGAAISVIMFLLLLVLFAAFLKVYLKVRRG